MYHRGLTNRAMVSLSRVLAAATITNACSLKYINYQFIGLDLPSLGGSRFAIRL